MHSHHHHEFDQNGRTAPKSEEQALMEYMLHHNEHHLEEFEELATKLRAMGKDHAAEHIDECIALMKQADEALEGAIFHLNEEEPADSPEKEN